MKPAIHEERPPTSDPAVGFSKWFGATDREILAAEIDDASAQMAACYEHLPPSAKASAMKLGHALSNLRRRMVAPNDKVSDGGGQ